MSWCSDPPEPIRLRVRVHVAYRLTDAQYPIELEICPRGEHPTGIRLTRDAAEELYRILGALIEQVPRLEPAPDGDTA